MAEQTAPSHRAGLRAEIADALEAADYRMDMRRGDLADAVLPVLYREWPWLRAEAEGAVLPAPVDRTAVLREAADELWALANRLTERGQGVLWAAGRLRRMAAEAQQ